MIALIAGPTNPPRFVQGLGLPYLGALLEDAGFRAKIFDLYPPSPGADDPTRLDQGLADAIAREHPSIVGVTIHTPAYLERVRLAKFIRDRLPNALLIAGGHHPTAEPLHLLQNSDFDLCVIGEGEMTLLEIAQGVVQGEGRGNTNWLRNINGILYKEENRIVQNPPRPTIADLDSLPPLAHHLLGLEKYSQHPLLNTKSTGIITYRGCPMRCSFCLNPQGRRVRWRAPSKVVDEMTHVVEEFSIHGFNFYDNLFGLNRNHAMAICEEILRRRLEVVWDCWTAGNLVDIELAKKMKEAGCTRVGFGAESGDDEVLIKSCRGFTAAEHRAGIEVLRAAGLKIQAFFMLGLPGESEESIRRTVELAKTSGADDVCLSLHRPYPGAALWRCPEAFGVQITRGPNFEAYIETETLSRSAILDRARWAGDKLKRCGLMKNGFLRCDRYAWE